MTAADGLQLLAPTGDTELHMSTFSGSARAQVVVDGIGMAQLLGGAAVVATVNGTGSQLGAVFQDGTFPSNVDSDVTREGATMANDAAFSGSLEVTTDLPSLPDYGELVTGGLDSLL